MPSVGASGRRTLVIIAATVAVLGSTVLLAAAAPELPVAPMGLSAFALLDNAGYATALGETVTGPEDDGGVPYEPTGTPGHDSVARVLGASGLLYTIDLYSLSD